MYSGYFIVTDDQILGIRKHECLLKRTKRGIPSGALQFESEKKAELELSFQKSWLFYPEFIARAWVEKLHWR